ncbi:MAG: hypothetical protein M1837_000801 [Sclerophora amabilis]|nr:MAG: hypothetical protein M1837_000801 [Sclerophora amabilis]
MALQSPTQSQDWRRDAGEQLGRWTVDFEAVLRQIPEDERKRTPLSSAFKGPNRPINPRSPYLLRKKRGSRQRNSCSSDEVNEDDLSDNPSDNSPERCEGRLGVDTPSKPSGERVKEKGSCPEGPSSKETQSRPYCTQVCLLGMVKGRKLDENCPNVECHRDAAGASRHPFGRSTFSELVQQQLARTLDHDCEPLGKQGARGALFKITLASHGYTFVAKGTVSAFVPNLRYEGEIYRKLRKLQGDVVPVCLGNIDLQHCYYHDVGVRIVHMLLMSWVGEVADQVPALKGTTRLEEETQRSEEALVHERVLHEDVRGPNVLWSSELQRVMLVDFERSSIIKSEPSKTLQQIAPNATKLPRQGKRSAVGK